MQKTIPSQTGVVRLHPDGGLDTGFGSNGLSLLNIQHAYVISVMELSSQKIIVFGCESINAENPPAIVTRLDANGNLDQSFGEGGHLRIDVGTSYDFIPNAVELPDGKIISSLFSYKGSQERAALVQILPDGMRDTSFGVHGVYLLPLPMNQPMALSLSGNELTVLGRNRNISSYKLYLHRLLLDLSVGVLNPNFEQLETLLYPNPIAETFTLEFELQEPAPIQVSVMDMQGKNVHEILGSQTFSEGKHAVSGSLPADLPAGNYVLSIISGQKLLKSIQITKG
ncbi:MAG: T9SS type A sorting domain-containing protein [Saprospiraceae bacterium]|nr:T9SS type A sorting domain-containing protein [Saprospiraceae bacterium]